ncbi:hypothetical protein A3F08_03675 [Candidatus Berkelbacteria bacterium RIFCSPHIGHO2_12_FULL_36_9]|uniref:Zn-dependent hydrolase n=1 Tax=Candidatus Berkelbacteria bacterium RIFCSPHIGHO2_12_FULL_36_9 TaxID=1797469 RepID=A0A1F5EHW2_9BACT|nr:MAG: hypothetical protein A3F08_03675 [Candidatus Berkelbacteria bacterium RIFCSPHIGHO2_12_FULL_36_9]
MTINFHGEGNFEIKCKEGTVITGEKMKINEFEIPGAGEYEVTGISAEMTDGIFTFRSEDMNLTYLRRKNPLNDSELERVKDTDILFIPIFELMESKTAIEVINQIEPKIVLPMFYQTIEQVKEIEGLSPETSDQLKITKLNLPQEERKVIVLTKR